MVCPGRSRLADVTVLAVGGVGKQYDATTGGQGGAGHGLEGFCDAKQKPRVNAG
jgi:hypothetical protein